MDFDPTRITCFNLLVTDWLGEDENGNPKEVKILNKDVSPQEMVAYLKATVDQHPDGAFDPEGYAYHWTTENERVRTLLISPSKDWEDQRWNYIMGRDATRKEW